MVLRWLTLKLNGARGKRNSRSGEALLGACHVFQGLLKNGFISWWDVYEMWHSQHSKMVHCFFLHPKKTAEIFRKSHFFLPNSGLPHGKAARHISGRDFFGFQQVFGGGLTRRRGKFSQLWPKTSWKMYWKMSLISDFPTRFVIGFMARWVWLTGFLPSHPPSGHPPGRPSQLCRRCDSDWEL